ncbi:hypothetical protein QEZ48_03090 [Aquamicrobium lusatiense]|uniref:hypothetical protein n=1 Tax=Aquamicrobium lusatiense TaxID=89772 RepID=UPI002454D3A3|nr:hypothetical protein [Aquamicrobium lusatiense]MDH4989811.1 hypothetical protein [Aquamicrobium lusatiense]
MVFAVQRLPAPVGKNARMVAMGNALAGISSRFFLHTRSGKLSVTNPSMPHISRCCFRAGHSQPHFRCCLCTFQTARRDVLSVCSGKDETVFSRPLLTRDGNVNFVANKKRQVLCT